MSLRVFFPSSSVPRVKKWVLRVIFLGSTLVYLFYMVFLFLAQDSIVFPKHSQRLDIKKTSISTLEEAETTTADGEQIRLWISPPKDGKPVLLFLPGNRGIIQAPAFLQRFATLTEDGCGLIAISYRGYGGSTGVPSEEGVKRDGEAAYEFAVKRFGKKHKIIAYGESLGTGIAVYLATQKSFAAVILQAPYTSLQDVAKANYPFPAAFLLRYSFPSDQLISQIHAPLLILHGAKDRLIPLAQAEILYTLAPSPKRLVIFKQASHGILSSSPEVLKFLHDFIHNTLPPEESRHVDAS